MALLTQTISVLNPIQTRKSNQKAIEYDQKLPQSHTADQHTAPPGRATEHLPPQDIREDSLSKATSSLFPIKIQN